MPISFFNNFSKHILIIKKYAFARISFNVKDDLFCLKIFPKIILKLKKKKIY